MFLRLFRLQNFYSINVAFLFSLNIDLQKLQKNLHMRMIVASGGNKTVIITDCTLLTVLSHPKIQDTTVRS